MMHEETGGLKNSRTPDAAWDKHRTRTKKCGDELEMQEDTIEKILTMLDQENLREISEENDTASEMDKSLKFSQSFKKKMHEMVAERLGTEAADRFIVNTAHMYETSSDDEQEVAGRMSQIKTVPTKNAGVDAKISEKTEAEQKESEEGVSSGKSRTFGRPVFKWLVRAAAVLAVVSAGFVYHKTNSVQATDLPDINAKPAVNARYSKVGALEEIISTMDYTNYSQDLDQVYVPGTVITGFEETYRTSKKTYFMIMYENPTGKWYQYQQTTMGTITLIDTEERTCEEVKVGEYPGVYTYDDEHRMLWWFDYNYAYQVQGNLSEEEMIAVAESLIEENN